MQFESEIYEAVEAGVSSSSGQQVWSVANTFLYVFSLSTSIGYGHLTPAQPTVRQGHHRTLSKAGGKV